MKSLEVLSSKKREPSPILKRKLGLFDSSMMMIGIVIGSGIFLTTGIMALSLPSPAWILLAWAVGGFIILAGALTYAELGAALPEAGGQYVYLREAYGPLPGFLFGWKMFLVNMTGSIAALGVAFAEYLGVFVPSLSTQRLVFAVEFSILGNPVSYSLSAGQLVAVVVILLLSLYNLVGVGLGKSLQNLLTVVKLGTVVVFIALGVFVGRKIPVDLSLGVPGWDWSQILMGFGVALVAVFWAFDGWNNINYVAGEIKDPGRNLPLALVSGTVVITVLYFLTNYVYFTALPLEQISGVVRIAERSATALHGPTAAGLISAMVLISVLGALNGAIFVGPRVYYAMARDGLFFRRVGRVHPRFHTPAFAFVLQAVWAAILALTGTFEQLFTFAMFVGILFWMAAALAVFTLRRKQPDLPRPYLTWGYPVVPAVFVLALCGVLLNTVVKKPVPSLIGLAFVVLGIPVFYLWDKKVKQRR
jgi:APA family basic amino acid/polyamine antiporter